MELDTRSMAAGTVLEADVCIIGGGPAGLAVASGLAGRPLDVLLLESGPMAPSADRQALNDGDTAGDPYAGLQRTRHRGIGGTTRLWNTPVAGRTGAKYAPLDPIDFDERPWIAHSGWPFPREHLDPYYTHAQDFCGLGPFEYGADAWQAASVSSLPELAPALRPAVYHLGQRSTLIDAKVRQLCAAGNVRLGTHATVRRLVLHPASRRIAEAIVASPGGGTWRVRAARFVLAGGAVEVARLLLLSEADGHVPGNGSGFVGRCFMEHPRDTGLTLVPESRSAWQRLAAFDEIPLGVAHRAIGRMALDAVAMREARTMNAAVTLLPRLHPIVRQAGRLLGRFGRLAAIRRVLPGPGHGWSRHAAPARLLDGFTVLLNLEQPPHPDNRVVLGARRDPLGDPVPELHWRWRAEDAARHDRIREIVRQALERAGFGRVHVDAAAGIDPNAHHHAGTTRMHADPRHGVVDAECRVHGVENLWIAGASVFPTAGYANPTLTVVALALRLADCLTSD